MCSSSGAGNVLSFALCRQHRLNGMELRNNIVELCFSGALYLLWTARCLRRYVHLERPTGHRRRSFGRQPILTIGHVFHPRRGSILQFRAFHLLPVVIGRGNDKPSLVHPVPRRGPRDVT